MGIGHDSSSRPPVSNPQPRASADGQNPLRGEAVSGAGSFPRRQHTGAAAIARALEDGVPLRLVLVQRGATDETLSSLLKDLVKAGVQVRETSANDLRRMQAMSTLASIFGSEKPDLAGGPAGADKVSEAQILGFSGPDPQASPKAWMADTRKPAWLLTGVAYPGNAGYAIRCAEVGGAAGIAFDVDYDRVRRLKALRTSMGAHRFLPVLWAGAEEVVQLARAAGRRIVIVEDCGDTAPWDCDLTLPSLLVIGGEERGVPRSLIEEADVVVRIPVAGFVPSYNLQAAMAMVAGEHLRQTAAAR